MKGQQETRYEQRGDAAWITLDRPEVRNALSATLVQEVFDHLRAAYAEPGVRAVVITGAGKGFCAGADLKNPPGRGQDGRPSVPYPDLLSAMLDGPKPVIAAVNGAAFAGGLGLVGAADLVIAADDATFSFSEVRIGVIPAIISVVAVSLNKKSRCMRLFLTAERFDAEAAVRYGLVHEAVPRQELEGAVEREVGAIRLGGPHAVAECKRLVRRVSEWTIDEGLARTQTWSAELFATAEAQEGIAAFREKRAPSWVQRATQGEATDSTASVDSGEASGPVGTGAEPDDV